MEYAYNEIRTLTMAFALSEGNWKLVNGFFFGKGNSYYLIQENSNSTPIRRSHECDKEFVIPVAAVQFMIQ